MLPGLPHWLLQVVNWRFRMWFSSYTHYRIFSHYVLKYLITTKFYQLWHPLERSMCHPCIACNKVSLLLNSVIVIVWFHVPMSFFETEYQQLFIIRLYATYKTLLEHCLKICAVLTYCQSSLPNHFYMRKCTLQLAAQFFHFRIPLESSGSGFVTYLLPKSWFYWSTAPKEGRICHGELSRLLQWDHSCKKPVGLLVFFPMGYLF